MNFLKAMCVNYQRLLRRLDKKLADHDLCLAVNDALAARAPAVAGMGIVGARLESGPGLADPA